MSTGRRYIVRHKQSFQMEQQFEDDQASDTATPKGSNFIHRGFNDLLAMLPTGSGTGASAFFTSTHDGSINGGAGYGESRNLPSIPIETPLAVNDRSQSSAWLWGHMMGEREVGSESSRRDATKTRLERATSIHQLAVEALVVPSRVDGEITNVAKGATSAKIALRELPATPAIARSRPIPDPPTARKIPCRPLPVPGVFPARPSVAVTRSPLSPPPSSTMVIQGCQRPKRPATHLPHVALQQPFRGEIAFSPPLTGSIGLSPRNMKPAKERRSLIPEGVLGSQSPRRKHGIGLEAVPEGKIDKRLISWPMDFR
jgi:hypothetical protein